MVHAVSNNGVVSLESVVKITEGQLDKIKAYPKEVKRALKDLHVSHIYAKTEDGEITSKMSMNITGTDDILEDVEKLKNLHEKFIAWVDAELTIEAKFEEVNEEITSLKPFSEKVEKFAREMAGKGIFIAVILANDNDASYFGNMHPVLANRISVLTALDYDKSE